MGNPFKGVSRSSGTAARVGEVSKTSKIQRKKGKIQEEPKKKKTKKKKGSVNKKPVEDIVNISEEALEESGVMAEFEKNILEQSAEISKEADKIFQAEIKSKVGKNGDKKPIPKLFKGESISATPEELDKLDKNIDLDDLKDILKETDKQVVKEFSVPKNKEPEVSKSIDVDLEKEDISPYDYGQINNSLKFKLIGRKPFSIQLNLEDPSLIKGNNSSESRVFYIDSKHPIYNKILNKTGRFFSFAWIRERMLNDVIFGTVIKALYDKLNYSFSSVNYKVNKESGKFDVIISDVIITYQDTAYYVLLERSGDNIDNMILINVDIIFIV